MAAAEKILSDYRSALDKDFADYQSSEIRLADMEVKTETTRMDKETLHLINPLLHMKLCLILR